MEKTNGAASILNLTAQAGLANLSNIGKSVQSDSGLSFSETFKKTSEVKPSANVESRSSVNVLGKASSELKTNVKTADDINSKQTDRSLDEKGMKDLSEEVKDAINKLEDKIKESFKVTDEELEEAMDVLGLTMVDLLNGSDLRNVIMEITGIQDSIELLTNVEVYDGLKEVTAFAENLLSDVGEKFSLTKEQMTEIINTESFSEALADVNAETDAEMNSVKTEETDAENAVKATVATANVVETYVPSDNQIEAIVSDDTANVTADTDKNITETGLRETKTVEVEVTKDSSVKTDEVKVAETETEKNEIQQTANSSKSGEKKNNLFKNDDSQNMAFQTTQTTQTVTTVGDIVETVTSYTSYADTENIMRQVTDFVKVNISGDVTEMEMQLHPASLGTVNMQINAQNGQVTAHLTVQNELVKSILEGQLVELQKTFDEQGTKVTAIEISVANYNLDSKNDNSFSGQENGSRRGNGRKSLNLNSIGSLDELTEEEQLEAEVMEMNGSSVNYTA